MLVEVTLHTPRLITEVQEGRLKVPLVAAFAVISSESTSMLAKCRISVAQSSVEL